MLDRKTIKELFDIVYYVNCYYAWKSNEVSDSDIDGNALVNFKRIRQKEELLGRNLTDEEWNNFFERFFAELCSFQNRKDKKTGSKKI